MENQTKSTTPPALPAAEVARKLPTALKLVNQEPHRPLVIAGESDQPAAVLLAYAEYDRLLQVAERAEERALGEVSCRLTDGSVSRPVSDVDAFMAGIISKED